MGEFDLIDRYFRRQATPPTAPGDTPFVTLGIGDDCALLTPSPGTTLAISTDMLLEGRHFLSTIAPERLGHKSLAVNLSDLAAMGAKPLAFTLGLALPKANALWCEAFARGLFALADQHNCTLIGGDTTAGPLCISISIFGEVPVHQALKRSGARVGDDIYVSHPLHSGIGDARLMYEGLCGRAQLPSDTFTACMARMELPTPRVALGMALRGIAHAAIDLSDGLLGDLGHILHESQVGARLEVDNIPSSEAVRQQPLEVQRLCTLSGGDDYELLFTAAPAQRAQIMAAAHTCQLGTTAIGRIEALGGIRLVDACGHHVNNPYTSFDHFQD